MLVKIKRTLDGRWNVQALSGGHYGEIIAVVEAFYMRNAEFGDIHLTGDLHGTWGVEVAPHIVGTTSEKFLMIKGENDELPLLEYEATHTPQGWEKKLDGSVFQYKESIPHVVGDSHDVWFSYGKLEKPFKGIPVTGENYGSV